MGRPPHPHHASGRRRRRRPWFPLCAGCTKILAKLCALLPLDFIPNLCYNNYRNNEERIKKKFKKILKNPLTNRTKYGIINTEVKRKREINYEKQRVRRKEKNGKKTTSTGY